MLNKRAFGLGMKRLTQKPQWSRDLEKVLPPTRAQFKRDTKYINDYNIYENIQTPITFKIENVTYFTEIMDKYLTKRLQAQNPPATDEVKLYHEIINNTASQLRLLEESPEFELTFGRAHHLTAASLLCISFEFIREYNNLTEGGRKIPLSIGITNRTLAGAERVMDLAVEYIVNKTKAGTEYIQEIAGLFRHVDLNQVMDFLKAFILTIKTMKYCAVNDKNEAPLLCGKVENGILNISSLYGHTEASINLERFKPLNSRRGGR